MPNIQSQEEIFNQVYNTYKAVFPGMLHSSGGLPDTKGSGTSDVDISLFHADHRSLSPFFPPDTSVDTSNEGRTIYTLTGYDREVCIYCSDGEWWDQAVRHRATEIALRDQFPDLFKEAFAIKKEKGVSTEAAWAEVLGLGGDYFEALLDTEKMLDTAGKVSQELQ